ncbi:MAG TPA: hypothetical protein VFG69_16575, partial [Nannocystaceae bacterium]|nr:hypothetical protein [Nannocystaceae bacterium]
MSAREVSVAVAVALDRAFDYAVPAAWAESPSAGVRVLVPFGPRVLVGVVRPTAVAQASEPRALRELLHVLDDDGPALPRDVVDLCEWMSDYYVAPIGEVYRLALPGLSTHADARVAVITEAGRRALEVAGPLLGGGVPELGKAEVLV